MNTYKVLVYAGERSAPVVFNRALRPGESVLDAVAAVARFVGEWTEIRVHSVTPDGERRVLYVGRDDARVD